MPSVTLFIKGKDRVYDLDQLADWLAKGNLTCPKSKAPFTQEHIKIIYDEYIKYKEGGGDDDNDDDNDDNDEENDDNDEEEDEEEHDSNKPTPKPTPTLKPQPEPKAKAKAKPSHSAAAAAAAVKAVPLKKPKPAAQAAPAAPTPPPSKYSKEFSGLTAYVFGLFKNPEHHTTAFVESKLHHVRGLHRYWVEIYENIKQLFPDLCPLPPSKYREEDCFRTADEFKAFLEYTNWFKEPVTAEERRQLQRIWRDSIKEVKNEESEKTLQENIVGITALILSKFPTYATPDELQYLYEHRIDHTLLIHEPLIAFVREKLEQAVA